MVQTEVWGHVYYSFIDTAGQVIYSTKVGENLPLLAGTGSWSVLEGVGIIMIGQSTSSGVRITSRGCF